MWGPPASSTLAGEASQLEDKQLLGTRFLAGETWEDVS